MKRRVPALAILAVALCGSYALLDTYDLTPGILTNAPKSHIAGNVRADRALADTSSTGAYPSDVTAPKASEVQQAIGQFVKDEATIGGAVSALVLDGITGQPIAAEAADVPRTPASVTKMATATAALDILGANTTLPTRAALCGDTLYLIGGGDTMLAAGKGDPHAVNGHAGLADLAQKVAAALKQSRDQSAAASGKPAESSGTAQASVKAPTKVVVDSSLFAAPLYASQVVKDDFASSAMQARPLAVDQSRQGGGEYDYHADPDLEALSLFAKDLADQGVKVSAAGRAQTPEGAVQLGRVESATIRQIVAEMMTVSNNVSAETLGHLIAIAQKKPATFEGAGQATTDYLQSIGCMRPGVELHDSSGLSTTNKLTASAIGCLLQRAATCSTKEGCNSDAFTQGLAIGGYTGTLANRYSGSLVGNVRGKTGTLPQSAGLSGFVTTARGYPLMFVAMADGFRRGSGWAAHRGIDTFVTSLGTLK
ncbi:MAG: D-alanyl-D-alanine carboxypeptidase/D-alanyl-D-alanine-endopeptidase [Actinomycetaceae bacterium]|nr:D-alanyl-D-alanine carboxypeptidase/D-alanyl-D-alanine-endopeptidase [Actinomycetaceae bacterium]MDY6083487.1 D-alanyl-D-alanine carboxypeptidase/D-alanyl-D-alanine-endopeptidase [Actinomycetaceae bacterium]